MADHLHRISWAAVVDAYQRTLDHERQQLAAVIGSAVDEATNPQTKAENKYDTRGLEASYLAAGQSRRLLDLDRLRGWTGVLAPRECLIASFGTLVILGDGDASRVVFVAPTGGQKLVVDHQSIDVVSPQSPLGQSVMGKEEGDEATLGTKTWEIEAIIAR